MKHQPLVGYDATISYTSTRALIVQSHDDHTWGLGTDSIGLVKGNWV